MGEHEAIPAGTPTQVAHPVRATVRTAAAYVVAAIAFLAAALPLVNEHLGAFLPDGWQAWLAGAVAFLTGLSALVTRLMALARAQKLLERIGLGSGAEKEVARNV